MAVSPFRSYHIATREAAADKLIMQRERELCLLENRWRGERKAARQRLLMTRMQAVRNNIRSWEDYVAQGCPRVPNATTQV
jgi:hypothetical protein